MICGHLQLSHHSESNKYIHTFFFMLIFLKSQRPRKMVWHGSKSNGERAIDTYCDAWHTSINDKMGLASSLLSNKLVDQESYPCHSKFIVLCIEAVSHETKRKKREAGDEQDNQDGQEEDVEDYMER